jgi:hypothetical protein
LRQEIFQGDGREVELAALEAVRDVASGLKGGVMQIDERDPLQEFVGLVLKGDMSTLEQATWLGCVPYHCLLFLFT